MTNIQPKIKIHTEKNPEDNAMLQALYSRSADSVDIHLEKLAKTGSGKFMEQYYVGYGHNSIADCGFVTVYLEGISMLAAKAIEDNPLYNGQESSSRYINWSNQSFYNPYMGTEFEKDAEALLTEMRRFYVSQIEPVKAHLRGQYPNENPQDPTYEKAITAKTFDILRGFLPCGATTNVAWTGSLRKLREHLELLTYHPLEEVKWLAIATYAELAKEYPSSFPIGKVPEPEVSVYNSNIHNFYNCLPDKFNADIDIRRPTNVRIWDTRPDSRFLAVPTEQQYASEKRPVKTSLHKHNLFNRFVRFDIRGSIDFGSFRDLQRHRGGYCGMPIVDNANNFHSWYYEQLPESSRAGAITLFNSIESFLNRTIQPDHHKYSHVDRVLIEGHNLVSKLKNQYLLPMGTMVEVYLSYDMPQVAYVTELRTGQTVHPTLRSFMKQVAHSMEELVPEIKIHPDISADQFSIKRGKQDIVAKQPDQPEVVAKT